MARDSYYAHGPLIPAVTLYWLFKNRNAITASYSTKMSIGAAFLFFAGCALQLVSSIFRIYFISCFAFVFIILGISALAFGPAVFKRTWYPLGFLSLMVPLPLIFISQTTLKMKFFVSEIAVQLINFSGIEAVREGSYIHMPNAMMLVGDPCSGLRSFLAFLCLGFVFAYESSAAVWKKGIIIFAGLPLAIVSNVIRVYILGMLGEIYGTEFIDGKVHDASGIFVFILALASLLWLRKNLEKGDRHVKKI